MKDAVQSDRAMNRSDSFKRDRRRMIERVNVFIKADPEEDDSDSDEDTAEPESRAGVRPSTTRRVHYQSREYGQLGRRVKQIVESIRFKLAIFNFFYGGRGVTGIISVYAWQNERGCAQTDAKGCSLQRRPPRRPRRQF